MSHDVRTHTRRKPGGGTTTVHRHSREDDRSPAERKRDQFERRVERERRPGSKTRPPGERRKRKKPNGWQRARKHARKARRLWRRHKIRALGHLAIAGVWSGAYGTKTGYRKLRRRFA